MTGQRARVLSDVRSALGQGDHSDEPGGFSWPGFTQGGDPVQDFVRALQEVGGFAVRGKDWRALVRDHAARQRLPWVLAPESLDLDGTGLEQVDARRAMREPERVLGLARAAWGVAASGSVVVEDPESLLACVLVQASLVVLEAEQIVGRLADLPAPSGRRLVVTGPARTADIEKKVVLGAHGARSMGVVLVDS